MTEQSEHAGKVVVITGAAQGIGLAIARKFSEAQARVVMADKNLKKLGEAASQLAAVAIGADISQPEQVRQLFGETHARFGRIDILINNAGMALSAPLAGLALEEWNQIIATNLTGTFLCSQEAARYMGQNQVAAGSHQGSIVNLASTRAFMSEPGWEAYAASKGGIVSLTHAMAASLAGRIQVNCISPGWVNTSESEPRPEDHRWHFAGRVGLPDDIAGACLYLTSPAARFISGSNLVMDGGVSKKMVYPE